MTKNNENNEEIIPDMVVGKIELCRYGEVFKLLSDSKNEAFSQYVHDLERRLAEALEEIERLKNVRNSETENDD